MFIFSQPHGLVKRPEDYNRQYVQENSVIIFWRFGVDESVQKV